MGGNDLYAVMHAKEQINNNKEAGKPVIVVIPSSEKQQFENGDFNRLLERILKREDPAYDENQKIHFRSVKEYRDNVQNDNTGKASLDIVCYDAMQKEQQRVVNGVKTADTKIQATDVVAPYIIRNLKTRANENYDKVEMVIGYNPPLGLQKLVG